MFHPSRSAPTQVVGSLGSSVPTKCADALACTHPRTPERLDLLAVGYLANIHAALGNRDEALRWLEFEPAHHRVAYGAAQGLWEDYRDEPRFQAVMRCLNLRFEPGDRYPVPLPIVPDELPAVTDSSRR